MDVLQPLIVIAAIIAVIYIIVSLRKQSAKAAEQQKIDEFRRLQTAAAAQDRAAAKPAGSGGMLQAAADSAAGLRYEKATDELERQTAELAAARAEADRAAARLTGEVDEALAAVQAAAAAHGGAVPGDGTANCPSRYPIKGNMPSMLFHEPWQPAYGRTIAEVCFQTAAAAEAAGFAAASDVAFPRADEMAAEEVVVVVGDGERMDVVAEAIAAADAGSVPPGAVRGDGSRDCPPAYPVKGNAESMLYHEPGSAAYRATIAEFCFSSAGAAEAAGFSSPRR